MPRKSKPKFSKKSKRSSTVVNPNTNPTSFPSSSTLPKSKPNSSRLKSVTSKLPPALQNKKLLPLLIFVILFAAVGSYLLIFGHATGSPIATVEAETMTLPTGTSVVTDTTASGGKAVQFAQLGTVLEGSVSLPSAATSFSITAHGSKCKGGWPTMTVSIDNNPVVTNLAVRSGSWQTYTVNSSLSSSSHTLSIKDTASNACRALYIDKLTFFGATTTTAVPTVSLSAAPTSVTAGGTSTLTWSSTDATSCSASNGWSGTKATSGTETTAAINANTTYTLSCTGSGGTTTANATITVGGAATSSLLSRKDFIYGSEIGAWRTNGKPAVDTTTPVPQKVIDAKIPVIRFALYDCFTDMRCGSDNHVGTQSRTNFDQAISGISNTLHATVWFKLLPIAAQPVNTEPSTSFCPSWTGPADGNLRMYMAQLDEIAKVYKGPLVLESNNEMEFSCWALWKSQGAPITGAGSVGVSKRIGEHFAQTMPALKSYATSLGFSQVVTVGYLGVPGGPGWGQACPADSSQPYGYKCAYLDRWVNEFNTAVHDAYVSNGNNPAYIPDVESVHAYPHSEDFASAPHEFDDKIVYAFFRNWIVQSRSRVNAIWGTTVGNDIRFSVSEWNAGVSNTSSRWSGWDTPSRVQAFYDGWLHMLQGDGNTTGSGTRYWSANAFLIAGNSDTGVGGAYNIVRNDGTTPAWYDTFKNISTSDPNR